MNIISAKDIRGGFNIMEYGLQAIISYLMSSKTYDEHFHSLILF